LRLPCIGERPLVVLSFILYALVEKNILGRVFPNGEMWQGIRLLPEAINEAGSFGSLFVVREVAQPWLRQSKTSWMNTCCPQYNTPHYTAWQYLLGKLAGSRTI